MAQGQVQVMWPFGIGDGARQADRPQSSRLNGAGNTGATALVGQKTECDGQREEENKQNIVQGPGSDNQDIGFNRARIPRWLVRRGEIRRHPLGQQDQVAKTANVSAQPGRLGQSDPLACARMM